MKSGIEKRLCLRFSVPGATVVFGKEKNLERGKILDPSPSPVVDLSRGGIRFLARKRLRPQARVFIRLSLPEEEKSLLLRGRVVWRTRHPGRPHPYSFGVQFNPYGEEKDQNDPQDLEKIIALERAFAACAVE